MDTWEGTITKHGVYAWRLEPDSDMQSYESFSEVVAMLGRDMGEFTITFRPGSVGEQTRFTVLEHPWKGAVT